MAQHKRALSFDLQRLANATARIHRIREADKWIKEEGAQALKDLDNLVDEMVLKDQRRRNGD